MTKVPGEGAVSRQPRGYPGTVDSFLAALGALIPSVGVFALFYLAIRAIIRSDRSEREALAAFEAEERLKERAARRAQESDPAA